MASQPPPSDADDPFYYSVDHLIAHLSPHLDERAIDSFIQNEVSGRVLLTLASYVVLKDELGIISLGRRERIMTAVKSLRASSEGYKEWVFEGAANTPLPRSNSFTAYQEIHRMQLPDQIAGRKRKRLMEAEDDLEQQPLRISGHKPILIACPWSSGAEVVRVEKGKEVEYGADSAIETINIPVIRRRVSSAPDGEIGMVNGVHSGRDVAMEQDGVQNDNPEQDMSPDERQLAMERAAQTGEEEERAGNKRKRIEQINISPLQADEWRMSIDSPEEAPAGEAMDTDSSTEPTTGGPKRIVPNPVEVGSDGRKRVAPMNIEPLRPPRELTPSPPLSPVVRRHPRSRSHYFPPKGRKIDSVFYDVDVGEEILDEYGEDDDWYSYGFPKPPGERQYVAKHIRRLHFQLSGDYPGIRTVHKGRVRGAFRPYSDQKAHQMLRKYELPSFTVVDVQPNGTVRVFRHTTKSLPTPLPWSEAVATSSDRTTDIQMVPHSFDPESAGGPFQSRLSLDDNLNHDWDYLLKWQNFGGDEVLPLYGDSGSENEFDARTWNEIQSEHGPKEKVLGKPTVRYLLSPAEVRQAIEDGIEEVTQKWRREELSRLESKHAYKRWRDAKKRKSRKQTVINARKRIQFLDERLSKQKDELLKSGMIWTSADQIKKVCRGNLSLTITEREEWKWTVDLMGRQSPPPKPEKRNQTLESHGADGDDEMDIDGSDDESIGSTDSEMISDDDEGLDGFIVGDNVKDDNARLPLPELEPEDLPVPDVVDSDSDDPDIRGPGRRGRRGGASEPSDDDIPVDSEPVNGDSDEPSRPASSNSNKPSPTVPTQAKAPTTPVKTEKPLSTTQKQKSSIDLTQTPKERSKRPPPVIIELSDDDDEHSSPLPKSRIVSLKVGSSLSDDELRRKALIKMMNSLEPKAENVLYSVYYHFKDFCTTRSVSDMFDTIRIVLRSIHEEKIKGVAGLTYHMESIYRFISRFYISWYRKKSNVPADYRVNSSLGKKLDNVDTFKLFVEVLQDCIKGIIQIQDDVHSSDDDDRMPSKTFARGSESNIVPIFRKGEGKGKSTVVDELMESSDSDDDPGDSQRSGKRKRKKVEEDAAAKESRERQRKFQLTLKRRIADQQKRAEAKGEVLGGGKVIINLGHLVKHKDIIVNDQIAEKLKKHQIKGIQFMWNQIVASGEDVGALLAHTMGLGKTLQVITLLYTLATAGFSKDKGIYDQLPEQFQMRDSQKKMKSLVLCPPGLINNWEDEFHQWIPVTDAKQYDLDHIGQLYRVDSKMTFNMRLEIINKWHQQGGVLIMGYSIFRDFATAKGGDSDGTEEAVFKRVEEILLNNPQIIVADEAHYFKNPDSKLTMAAMKFESTSRIAMTGSPLSNNLEEYWSMIEWIHPGFLGPLKEFRSNYVLPIADGLYSDSLKEEQRESLKLLGVLRKDVGMKMDRADISVIQHEMPAKTEFLVTIPLTKLQVDFYNRLLEDIRGNGVVAGALNGPDGPVRATSRRGHGLILNVSYLLALICAHPACFVKGLQEREDRRKAAQAKQKPPQAAVDEFPVSLTAVIEDELDMDARSLEWAKRLLDEAPSGGGLNLEHSYKMMVFKHIIEYSRQQKDQVLVFTHHQATLNSLDNSLREWGVDYVRIDGQVLTTNRQAAAKRFNEGDSEVMLISTQAGGLGLNLYGANRVIIFDFSFNPMWEQQAVGRAYRMGQKKHVFVYRFLSGGTFETYLWNMAQFKNQLQSRVVDMKNPVRNAKKSLKQYLLPPREIPMQPDIDTFKGKDAVLDKLLATQDYVRGIANTETFQPDQDDVLTAEEQAEADAIYKRNLEQRKTLPKPRRKLVQTKGDMQPPPSTAPASVRPSVPSPPGSKVVKLSIDGGALPRVSSFVTPSAPSSASEPASSSAIPSASQPSSVRRASLPIVPREQWEDSRLRTIKIINHKSSTLSTSASQPSSSSRSAAGERALSTSPPSKPPSLPQALPGQNTPNRFGFNFKGAAALPTVKGAAAGKPRRKDDAPSVGGR